MTKEVIPIHGNDHCPGGPDPIPCFPGSPPGFHAHKLSTLTVVSGNSGRLEWDEWTIDGGTEFFQEGALSGSDLIEVELWKAGWYSIHCWAAWTAVAQPASGFGGIAMISDPVVYTEPNYAMSGVTYPVNFASGPTMTLQIVRHFPSDFTSTWTSGFVNRLEFWVVQNSGVNRNIVEAYCNIAYLGARST